MNRFMMILIFALCAALANASFVTQSLEERLLAIEERLAKVEQNTPKQFQFPPYGQGPINLKTIPCLPQQKIEFIPNLNGGK